MAEIINIAIQNNSRIYKPRISIFMYLLNIQNDILMIQRKIKCAGLGSFSSNVLLSVLENSSFTCPWTIAKTTTPINCLQ